MEKGNAVADYFSNLFEEISDDHSADGERNGNLIADYFSGILESIDEPEQFASDAALLAHDEADTKAIDLLTTFTHELPRDSPLRKSLLNAVTPAYDKQCDVAKRFNVSQSLVSRAANAPADAMKKIRYPPNVHRPR
jgi:hypothetical protein